ncbi:MAG: dTDP-4-dehydrorhamnose 3,5-epimerase family protein [Candidatus Didemnitutus sp.]|nr:dTDP-4-dehydrorhamnose 3,5-epimerase family protein [Candidatus Didemnitutus sp.]
MDLQGSRIPGCGFIRLDRRSDDRGDFCKLFQQSRWQALGLGWPVREQYVSTSHHGVVRGMHFQLPPHDHHKVVACLRGAAQDVVLDLRLQSPTFGRFAVFELHAEEPALVVVPRGCAHGFCARGDDTVMGYWVETEHVPSHDAGIRWDSFGHTWPISAPLLSPRDRALPDFATFTSPFHWKEGTA